LQFAAVAHATENVVAVESEAITDATRGWAENPMIYISVVTSVARPPAVSAPRTVKSVILTIAEMRC